MHFMQLISQNCLFKIRFFSIINLWLENFVVSHKFPLQAAAAKEENAKGKDSR